MKSPEKTNQIESEDILENIFFEIGFQQRLDIVLYLYPNPSRLSAIAKDLEMTAPEAHRNITRLQSAGLLEKEKEGLITLTEFGRVIARQIPSFRFLAIHKDYFMNHNTDEIPPRFIQSIGVLEGATFVKEAVDALDVWSKIARNSKKFLYLISPIVVTYFMEMILAHVLENEKNGYVLSYLIPRGAGLGESYDMLRKKYQVYQFVSKGVIRSYRADDVRMSLIINEQEAAIGFPSNSAGSGQEFSVFYGNNPEFHQWCIDYYQDRVRHSEAQDAEKYRRLL